MISRYIGCTRATSSIRRRRKVSSSLTGNHRWLSSSSSSLLSGSWSCRRTNDEVTAAATVTLLVRRRAPVPPCFGGHCINFRHHDHVNVRLLMIRPISSNSTISINSSSNNNNDDDDDDNNVTDDKLDASSVDGNGGDDETKNDNLLLPTPKFQDLDGLDSILKSRIVQRLGLDRTMTEIQSKTWDAAFVDGSDVIGRARTGTGKTLAFLLPSVERILRMQQQQQQQQQQQDNDDGVHTLIISPTRELAQQIYKETLSLTTTTTPPPPQQQQQQRRNDRTSATIFYCQVLYGGRISKRQDLELMHDQGIPKILIATPGRLLDHLSSSYVGNGNGGSSSKQPFSDIFSNTKMLVLDEMDRLLDLGFRDDIRTILSFLPDRQQRQTLLFSATVPSDVRDMIDTCVKDDDQRVMIDCINDDDPTTHTSSTIQQNYVILPLSKIVSGIVQLVLELMKQPQHKVLVFLPTTSQVAYFADLFNHGLGRQVLEMHSKMNQNTRSWTSDRFRHAQRAVMFTSDVSARGVDYPNVTHVIQVGVASNREAHIHRSGRTGRAGKKGKSLLVLLDSEKEYLNRELDGLEILPDRRLQALLDRPGTSVQVDNEMMRLSYEIRNGQLDELKSEAESVYRALLGYYGSKLRSLGGGISSSSPAETVIDIANAFAIQAGLQELPTVSEKLARQLGIMGNPRISVHSRWSIGTNFDVGTTRRGRGGKKF